jgi:hypothetical protein
VTRIKRETASLDNHLKICLVLDNPKVFTTTFKESGKIKIPLPDNFPFKAYWSHDAPTG